MAVLKTAHIGGAKFRINVDTSGRFYVNVPADLSCAFAATERTKAEGCVRVSAETLEALETKISNAMNAFNAPEITVEHIIQYNIESHAAFWEAQDGTVYPNGYADPNRADDSGKWSDEKFGGHHAARTARGGYSLTIGAHAYKKVTKAYRGGRKTTDYKKYYGENGDHFGFDNPAEKLNSWQCFWLDPNAETTKEIPYSDEAALFFHGLMMSMALLSKEVQERTFKQANLLELISEQKQSLLPSTVVSNSGKPLWQPTES